MATICYYSAAGDDLALLAEAAGRLSHASHTVVGRSGNQLNDPAEAAWFASTAARASAIIWHGETADAYAWQLIERTLDDRRAQHLPLPWVHLQPASGAACVPPAGNPYASGVTDGSWARLAELLATGGLENLITALAIIVNRANDGCWPVPLPLPMPAWALSHPDAGTFTSLAGYRPRLLPERPTVAVAYPRSHWLSHNTAHIDSLVHELEYRGANVLPFFYPGEPQSGRDQQNIQQAFDRLCSDHDQPVADAMISVNDTVDPTDDDWASLPYPQIGVPVLRAVTSTIPREKLSSTSADGPLADSVPWGVSAWPGRDGRLATPVIACQETIDADALTGARVPRLVPITGSAQALAVSALSWVGMSQSGRRLRALHPASGPQTDHTYSRTEQLAG
ncbi:cobaltochelatase subunit CobN [Propionimicrobium sp. PCR01-08-3]|uniref:cobaltochelatase subunit CobN n=1 Tax=Propionimicrobium sp. PCR01-08-3 TaxID=3052086 RepID=UPI00255D120D|nr:cobaltochelatase subunit CobN [Propionimicrobium sp. PCR01-08-3]WIY82829.1 cobaltochelatase subunit CobN [Propionimicrobium sp. PCR01-08-3]